ncbi:MAG: MFS transporter [Chitinophagaceae bacterium]|nr:MFS transporter [Chitinophagaceae bacterium]
MTDVSGVSSGASISSPTGDKPSINRILVFVIVAFALLMTTVDVTIIATALPTLQKELHTTVNWAGWTLTAYSFGFVLMLPISGKYSERYGHRKVFLISTVTFTLASLCCGLAGNIYILIVLRVVQAIGGAGITPSVTGIIVQHFGDERDRAVSLFGSIFPIGAMIGPIFGGLFVTYWTWREIFFVNVPIGLLVIILAIYHIPHDLTVRKQEQPSMDFKGILLLGIGILSGMFATSYLGERNVDIHPAVFILLIITAIIAFISFFRHIIQTTHPIIAPRLIYGKGFGAVNLINVALGGVTQGVIALVPLYASRRYDINALDSGTLLVAEGIAAVVFSTLMAMALRRTGYRPPLYAGGLIIITGTVMLAFPPLGNLSPYMWLATSTFLIGVGAGTINPSSRNAGLQLAPEHSSIIASLRSMSLQIGAIITIAIATAIISGFPANQAQIHAHIYMVIAPLLILALPLISKIPEHHGSW